MSTEIRREQIELPTYETGPENPNSSFAKRLGAHPYPYRLQNRLTGVRTVRAHDAVILENEFLRLTFLPDFGCRLFSAYDKLMGREIFYRNDCIKPALIAIRGAWISGGVEFNFPVSHSVYTHSRIPHTTRRNHDGSASMIFGLTEQMSGMRFTVEVALVPGEYRFSQRVRLYNGTSLPHRHYWWTNAAVSLTPETQMIYPMISGISGTYGDKTSWPIHEDIDLSMARNHRSACDVFARETYDEFFGVYHWDLGYGVAHWAKQEELPARKMFFWGQDEMGQLWQKMLTENAGDYLEIQAGRFATQSDFDLLRPHELVEFTEYWIPVGKTDGFVKAHPEGVISLRRDRSSPVIAIQLTRTIERATMRVMYGSALVIEKLQSFDAGAVYRFQLPETSGGIQIEVLDGSGSLVLSYDSAAQDARRDEVPRTCVMPRQIESPDEILQAARIYERTDSPASAEAHYQKLMGTAQEAEARKGLARLALLAGRYADAENLARRVLESGTDTEATYYLALALGDTVEAADLLRTLVDDPGCGVAARKHLATKALRQGEYHQAVEVCGSAPVDQVLRLACAVAMRKQGHLDDARVMVAGAIGNDPLCRRAQWESLFLSTDSTIEMQAECFQEDMDAAAWYRDLGMDDDAKIIIQAWAQAGAPQDPIFDTLTAELGIANPTDRHNDQAGVAQCFAHGDASVRLLANRHEPQARVHLGNILFARGRVDEAIAEWEQTRSAGISDHIPCRHLALAYWQRKNDPNAAYGYMYEAHEICPTDADTLRDLDILAELSGHYEERTSIADEILRFAKDDSPCLERAIRVLLEVGRLDEAVELLTTKKFFVAELAYQTRILFVRALLTRGARSFASGDYESAASDFRLATTYPENLGASRFHDSSDAQAYYLLGLALDAHGQSVEASGAWTHAAEDMLVSGTEQAYYVGMARRRLGRSDADEVFDKIAPHEPASDSPYASARTEYLLGLRALTSGRHDQSEAHFKAAAVIETAEPVKMHNYLESLCYKSSDGRRVPIPVWWTMIPIGL